MALGVTVNAPSPVIVGSSYAGSVTASGGTAPYTYAVSAGSLPGGLSLDPATGAITGTVSAPGSFDATVTATDATLATADGNVPIVVEAALTAPAMPLIFRSPLQWSSDDCLKAGHQMARVFFDAVQTPRFSTILRGNLQSPIGLIKSVMFNIRLVNQILNGGDIGNGSTLTITSSQTLQRITIGVDPAFGAIASAGNATCDVLITGACPLFIADETEVQINFGEFSAVKTVDAADVRLFFCNFDVPPFMWQNVDNASD